MDFRKGWILAALVSCGLIGGSCAEPGAPAGFLVSRNPINGVELYLPLYHVIQVGETTKIDAEGFYNGNGFGAEYPKTVSFESSDTTVVRLTPTTWTMSIMPSMNAHGSKEGTVTLKATINGVSAADTLRVIPEIGSITLTPSSSTLYVGDSVTIGYDIRAVDGRSISSPTPILQIANSNYGIVYFVAGRWVKGNALGTVTLFASIGPDTGGTALTVLARP